MSVNNYHVSRKIEAQMYPFYALIMAAMRKADSRNLSLLKGAWPDIYAELNYRYWSGGGLMPGEEGYSAATDDNLYSLPVQPEADEWCRGPDCRYRHWRSGFPTHKRGADCPVSAS